MVRPTIQVMENQGAGHRALLMNLHSLFPAGKVCNFPCFIQTYMKYSVDCGNVTEAQHVDIITIILCPGF